MPYKNEINTVIKKVVSILFCELKCLYLSHIVKTGQVPYAKEIPQNGNVVDIAYVTYANQIPQNGDVVDIAYVTYANQIPQNGNVVDIA